MSSAPALRDWIDVALAPELAPRPPAVRWVVRAIWPSRTDTESTAVYSARNEFHGGDVTLTELTTWPTEAHRFASYDQAAAFATHLSFVYQVQFKAVARVPANQIDTAAARS